jgi:hypothetical protein
LVALLVAGCSAPQATPEQIAAQREQIQNWVEAVKASGVDGTLFIRFRLDKIGGLNQTLEGPGEVEGFFIANAKPDKSISGAAPDGN